MQDTDSIFLLGKSGNLERVPHQEYQSEDLLQDIVERHPELIVGEQINPDDPPRWLVIRREAGISGSDAEGSRWSVDHLLLDQHGRPTFVEVKRSSDSRIRREIVGQMLDYAANAQKYWPVDRIKTLAIEEFGSVEDLNHRLNDFLSLEDSTETDQDLEVYWNTVEQNLRSGQVRLLFVADKIPAELKRVIEFLNEHMPLIEVLGVEIRQYQRGDIQALVPRVIGQTESARQQKRSFEQSKRKITKEEFLADASDPAKRFFERLISEATKRGFFISWGTKGFSVRLKMQNGQPATLFYSYPPGVGSSSYVFQFYLGYLKDSQVYKALQKEVAEYIQFKPTSGKYTFEISLDEAGLRQAESGLSAVLDVTKRLVNEGAT